MQSGEYCFKFEKSQWDNYWDPDWGTKDNGRKYSMPWQIIPIETSVPIDVDVEGFNVITYIKTDKSNFLREKIQKLFSSSSFLLFLRHTHINIDFVYENKLVNIRKRTYNDVVELLTNNKLDKWLVYSNPAVLIDDEIRNIIATDGITPIKLQEAKTFDISFALLLDNKGRIVPLENSCVYTYLPTSITFGFPFLVNANFITDAGRQHLVNDSEWNKMIVKEIPMEFLKWMAMISLNKPSYYKALPALNIGTEGLCSIYNSAILKALNEIAFIPSAKGDLLKASDAIMDRIGIAEIIGMESLLEHINRQYQKSFTEYSFINNGGITILREYGVFDFSVDKLKLLFGDESTLKDIPVSKDIDLIKFLYDLGNHSEKEEHLVKEIIADLPFIYSEDKQLCKPIELFFPSDFKADNSITNDVSIIHHEIYTALSNNLLLMEWVKNVGVCEMNEINIIANHICKNGYITNNNALDVGKYLFRVWEKNNFTLKIPSPSRTLSNLKFITNKGNLKGVDELYQSSKYFPALDLQTVCDADIFISDDYCDSTNESTRRKWHNFLRDMNVCDDIQLRELKFKRDTDIYNLLKSYVAFAENHEYNHSSWTGGDYYMSFRYINIKYVPYLSVKSSDFDLSKLIWSYILSQPIELNRSNDYIYGSTGWNYDKKGYLCDKSPEHDYLGMNFLTWVIKNHQTFPASNGEMLMASDLYKNTPLFKDLFGEYLPYLDVDCEIDNSWNEILSFKTDPPLEDYLLLLSKISNDKSKADENKQRISKIYQYIVENFNIDSEKSEKLIKEWAQTGKILSREGVFVTPSELRHISLDGFSDKQRVYIGQVESRNKVLDLLKIMGVKIITENSVKPEIQNQEERDEIKHCLTAKAKVLALLKAGEKPTKEDYDKELSSINTQLNDTHFYHCSSIKLSYGNDNDTIEKVTFGNNSNFFYTGEVRLAKIDPLLTPLCNYLQLKGKERELIVTMFEDMSAIREYLQEKEYQVSFLEDVKDDSSHVFTASLNYSRNDEQRRRDAITGHLGEIIVYEKLKEMGYTPICLSLSDENDYEDIVEYKGKKYYCKSNYGRYDIEFVTGTGGKMLVEVKSTTMSKESQENMPISYREISLVEEYSNNEETSYIIVRVFNVNSSNPDIYIFKGHTI